MLATIDFSRRILGGDGGLALATLLPELVCSVCDCTLV
jgi:hypothetical protein